MAIECYYEMRVRGTKEAIEHYDVVSEKVDWGQIDYGTREYKDADVIDYMSRFCYGSVYQSLLFPSNKECISLFDLSEECNVDIEIVGVTEGDISKGSIEHYLITNGKLIKRGDYGVKRNYRKRKITIEWEVDFGSSDIQE